MAQVIPEHNSDSVIDAFVEQLLGFWRTVPELAAEWPEWDEFSRQDLVIEWPLMREKVRRVSQAAESGELNASQLATWREIQRLIALHHSTFESLIGERAL